ncbi:hypothetical protein CJ030_MR1G004785 [Morella rubra]|uniref:Uncharacterized protein n=1 Tax=Morella rubra TaxID=262757 RepID=A0A6A1WK38_9ROSI|nr:hypothetical protein CJ030_MR1G004785 [Morella rubra]
MNHNLGMIRYAGGEEMSLRCREEGFLMRVNNDSVQLPPYRHILLLVGPSQPLATSSEVIKFSVPYHGVQLILPRRPLVRTSNGLRATTNNIKVPHNEPQESIIHTLVNQIMPKPPTVFILISTINNNDVKSQVPILIQHNTMDSLIILPN